MTIYLKALELAAIGGTNYTGAGNLGPGGTLLAAASQFSTMTPQQIDLSMIVVNTNNAAGAGAIVTTDIQVLAQAIKCLKNFDLKMQSQMDLQLTCELGEHAVYPQ